MDRENIMRYGPGLGQNGVVTRVEPETRIPAAAGATVKEIPYDYVATFKLTGVPATRLQDVITVSTEGVFVAVSIGYSFIPDRRALGTPTTVSGRTPLEAFLGDLFPTSPAANLVLKSLVHCFLIQTCGLDFKYSIVDSGTGRELQNQFIHNIAGLGSADGDRPFRPFARPALFMPRSTIRFEVEEISEGPLYADGILFIVLHGYKRLGE